MEAATNEHIGDGENTPIFPSTENWLGFRARVFFPFGQETIARLAPSKGFLYHPIDHSIMYPEVCAVTVSGMHTHLTENLT